MNLLPMLREGYNCLDNIVLKPKLSLSLSSYNRRTGNCSQQQCISLSTGFTLLHGMMMLAGTTAAVWGAVCYLRRKERKKWCRAMKKEMEEKAKVSKP